ncbi:hypothetical protein KKB43_00450 [Patescibacteria group bacterium]|nr:hypothetical protein [Patescibacteria group bacterium]MBU4141931.1 hypothetical protein [Patescibacteria group bacterium]MBU4339127.1 hypothetical protein [Patescibacteria group bacterium]MBU4579469.1 hypothetical protein [Patescibacteria group bacterium]
MKTKNQTIIFSTGVHLQSEECIINGRRQWRWVAVGFEDDSFLGGRAVNPAEYANKKEKLIEKFKD